MACKPFEESRTVLPGSPGYCGLLEDTRKWNFSENAALGTDTHPPDALYMAKPKSAQTPSTSLAPKEPQLFTVESLDETHWPSLSRLTESCKTYSVIYTGFIKATMLLPLVPIRCSVSKPHKLWFFRVNFGGPTPWFVFGTIGKTGNRQALVLNLFWNSESGQGDSSVGGEGL